MVIVRAWEVIGAAATAIGLAVVLFPKLQTWFYQHSFEVSASVGLAALAIGSVRIFQPNRVAFKARGGLAIELKVGDLFLENEAIVVPVNDFFDTQIGPISEHSVHGQFLQRQYPNQEKRARTEVDAGLRQAQIVETVTRTVGAKNRYRVGEVAVLQHGKRRYVLLALTETDSNTQKTSANLSQYVTALESLWINVRNCCNHQKVALPLMGPKTARVGLSKATFAELILTSAVRAHMNQPFTEALSLIFREDDLDEIDLFDLKRRFV